MCCGSSPVVTLVDAVSAFTSMFAAFKRKPGGWRLPMTNMIMGPPIFAPLLFGTSAYLGLIASYLQREEATRSSRRSGKDSFLRASAFAARAANCSQKSRTCAKARFQRQVAIVTGVSALLSGFEAYYSHYKNNFRYWAQWTPVVLAPCSPALRSHRLRAADWPRPRCLRVCRSPGRMPRSASSITRAACFAVPAAAKHLLYNIMYGPPIFAPLLFGAAGMLGVLASLLRRRRT